MPSQQHTPNGHRPVENASNVIKPGDAEQIVSEKLNDKDTPEQHRYDRLIQKVHQAKEEHSGIDKKNGNAHAEAEPICPAFSAQLRSEHDSGPKVQDKKIRKQYLYVFKNPIALIHNNVLPSGCY